MKRLFKRVSAFLLATIMIFSLAGCGSESDNPLVGKWAYNHDTETTILNLKDNGKAIYQKGKYEYTYDDNFFYLTSKKGNVNLRYEMDGDEMLLYETAEYTYTGEGEPQGILGVWEAKEKQWSFEFTEEGTFMEDGYFPGYFFEDKESGTIKLMYNDQFYDTILYYTIDGNRLIVEYPWTMVKR